MVAATAVGVVDEVVVEVGSADTDALTQHHHELTGLQPTPITNPSATADGKRGLIRHHTVVIKTTLSISA